MELSLTEKVQKRVHLYISGRVQGVNFRYYTRQQALYLGVRGWVRNLMDGRVEAIIEGNESSVEKMLEWCHHGPRGAWVNNVDVRWEEPTGEFTGFEIRMSYG